MDKKELRAHILSRWQKLKTERDPFIPQWKSIATHIRPATGKFLLRGPKNEARERFNEIFDNTATGASNLLSSGLMSGLTDPSQQWFYLTTGSPTLDESPAVKQWLADVSQVIYMGLSRTNAYQSLHHFWLEVSLYGTAAMMIQEDDERGFYCYPFTIGEYAIACNHKGIPDTLYRELMMTVAQIVQQYGYENVPRGIKALYDQRQYDQEKAVIHAIEPRYDRDITKQDNKNMPFRAVHMLVDADSDEHSILLESGYNEFPAIVGRWGAISTDTYSCESPGMTALGDVRQLKHEQMQKGNAIDLIVDPPRLLPTSAKDAELDFAPGGLSFVDMPTNGSQSNNATTAVGNINPITVDIQEVQGRIKAAFFTDLFLMLSNQAEIARMTATAVARLQEEKLIMLGPILSRFNNEVLNPFIGRIFSILSRAGIFPPPPQELQGTELNIEYTSMLARSQKEVQANTDMEAITQVCQLAQVDPSVLDRINLDNAIKIIFDKKGVSPSLLRSDEEVRQIQQQRAQQQQQMAQQEQAQQGVDALSKLGKVPAGGDTMAGQAVEALQAEMGQ